MNAAVAMTKTMVIDENEFFRSGAFAWAVVARMVLRARAQVAIDAGVVRCVADIGWRPSLRRTHDGSGETRSATPARKANCAGRAAAVLDQDRYRTGQIDG
jgi:hypothetical protein